MNEKQENWGCEKFDYTRDQIKQFIVMFIRNNGLCRPTLECSELIWPGRHYSFAAFWFDKITEKSNQSLPIGQFVPEEELATSILESVWNEQPNEVHIFEHQKP